MWVTLIRALRKELAPVSSATDDELAASRRTLVEVQVAAGVDPQVADRLADRVLSASVACAKAAADFEPFIVELQEAGAEINREAERAHAAKVARATEKEERK